MQPGARRTALPWYGAALFLVVVAAAAVRFYFASAWPLEYDEAWNLFYAVVRPLENAWSELKYHAHPPIALGAIWIGLLFGEPLFWARIASVIPGLAVVGLAFVWARSLGLVRPIPLLLALALALSPIWVHLSIVVRYYALMNACLVVAALAFVHIARKPDQVTGRQMAVFVGASLLAMWTEYPALLATLSMAASLPALAVASIVPWRDLRAHLSRHWAWWGVLAAGAAGLIAYLKLASVPVNQSHVSKFYRAPSEGYLAFAWRGLGGVAEQLTFLDGLGGSTAAFVLALGLLAAIGLEVRRGRDGARAAIVLSTVFLIAELAVLGAVGVYPFGGLMRHQVVLFPFLVLLFGMGLDWIIRATGRFGMAAVPAIVAAVTVVWCVRGLTSDYRGSLLDPPWPRFERQYAALQPHLRPGQVLYLTHYAQFGFFSQTMTHRWSCTVRPRFGVYDYSIADGSVAWRAIVDREVWQPRWPVGPESADRLASLMRESALRELLVVSWVNGKAAEANPNGRDDTIRNLAARGLVMDRWFRIGDGYAFVLASSGR